VLDPGVDECLFQAGLNTYESPPQLQREQKGPERAGLDAGQMAGIIHAVLRCGGQSNPRIALAIGDPRPFCNSGGFSDGHHRKPLSPMKVETGDGPIFANSVLFG